MDDRGNSRERWEEDATVCPICGHEEYAEPCDHLLADFSTDLSDGDGGVLGEGWAESVLRTPARQLGRACRDLLLTVWKDDGGEDRSEARLAVLREMTTDDGPTWWNPIVDGIENNDDCSADDPGLGDYATPVVHEIVTDVPGVLASEAILGGMTSSSVCFVWSQDRGAATQALEARIAEATSAVQRVLARVADA